MDVRWRSNGIL